MAIASIYYLKRNSYLCTKLILECEHRRIVSLIYIAMVQFPTASSKWKFSNYRTVFIYMCMIYEEYQDFFNRKIQPSSRQSWHRSSKSILSEEELLKKSIQLHMCHDSLMISNTSLLQISELLWLPFKNIKENIFLSHSISLFFCYCCFW